MATVTMTVNGKAVTADVEPRTLLVQFLRENLRLTGTHVGCDTSQCGACVVHLDGRAVKSCTVLALQCEGAQVTTIEGWPTDGKLHPMQEAFREHHGLQCGFCTPGMIMAAVDIVNRKGTDLDEQTIRERARRQSLPLHGLPQHRQGDRSRRARRWARADAQRRDRELAGSELARPRSDGTPAGAPTHPDRRIRMKERRRKTIVTATGIGAQCAARKTSASSPARAVHRRHQPPGADLRHFVRSPHAHATSERSTRRRRWRCRASSPCSPATISPPTRSAV